MYSFVENQAIDKIQTHINYNEYKIYGVQFDGTNSTGVRLYNAKGLQFTPSSNSKEGVDDFYAIEDSPFHTRKCIREYNKSTKITTYTFEDTDPEKYNTLRDNKIGARMIAFPKFYYDRPNRWTFLVSSEKVPGFKISPMHYKREILTGEFVEHLYVYVSEFMYNDNGDVSQPGYAPRLCGAMNAFRRLAFDNGMCVEDLSCRMMITMLAIIKYANLDAQSIIGNGHSEGRNTDIQYDDIKGHDGYRTSNIDNTSIKIMDLVDWYGNAWELIEGCCTFNNKVYINNDTKNISCYPNATNYKQLGWSSTDIFIPNGENTNFSSITYDIDYPYLLAPSKSNGEANPFGDKFWQYNYDTVSAHRLIFGGSGWDKASAGLFCWNSSCSLSLSDVHIGARFVTWGF